MSKSLKVVLETGLLIWGVGMDETVSCIFGSSVKKMKRI